MHGARSTKHKAQDTTGGHHQAAPEIRHSSAHVTRPRALALPAGVARDSLSYARTTGEALRLIRRNRCCWREEARPGCCRQRQGSAEALSAADGRGSGRACWGAGLIFGSGWITCRAVGGLGPGQAGVVPSAALMTVLAAVPSAELSAVLSPVLLTPLLTVLSPCYGRGKLREGVN